MAATSGIKYLKTDFSLITAGQIPVGSYLIGFDVNNAGKLSKMDSALVLTVIEGGGTLTSVVGGTNITIDNTNPAAPIINGTTSATVVNFAITPALVNGSTTVTIGFRAKTIRTRTFADGVTTLAGFSCCGSGDFIAGVVNGSFSENLSGQTSSLGVIEPLDRLIANSGTFAAQASVYDGLATHGYGFSITNVTDTTFDVTVAVTGGASADLSGQLKLFIQG